MPFNVLHALNTNGGKSSHLYIKNNGMPYAAKPTVTVSGGTYMWDTKVLAWAAGWVKVRVKRKPGPMPAAAGATTLDEITVTVTTTVPEELRVPVSYLDDPDVDPPKKD